MTELISRLLASEEPSVRYRVRVYILGQDPAGEEARQLQVEIQRSPRVQRLLAERDDRGEIPAHPYAKWYGAHWVLADLADLGYPPGDERLLPLRDQIYRWLFGRSHLRGIKEIDGRVRRCASQEGNALFSSLALGLADERTDELAANLIRWQWPDGGWNCDKKPEARTSSFMETLIPLRGLALHAPLTGSADSRQAAERAAEVFLKRHLFRRQSNGNVIRSEFLQLHYPCYWHYDILFGLKVMAEAGFIGDPRCAEALDRLEARRLPDGGWPADRKYYRTTGSRRAGFSFVDWGGTSKQRMNEFVTADALYVLHAAGRFEAAPAS